MNKKVSKVTFRLTEPYDEIVAERAAAANMSVGKFARLATMFFSDRNVLEQRMAVREIAANVSTIKKALDGVDVEFE